MEMLFLFKANDEKRDAFVLVRSPFRSMAKKKLQFIVDGHGLLNWTMVKLTKAQTDLMLSKYQTDALYELAEDQTRRSRQ